jgi:hypothetical protein
MNLRFGSLALTALVTLGCQTSAPFGRLETVPPVLDVPPAAPEKKAEAPDIPAVEPEPVKKTLPRGDLALGTRAVLVWKASCRLLFSGEALVWMKKELGARLGAATFARYCGLSPQPPASRPATSRRAPR